MKLTSIKIIVLVTLVFFSCTIFGQQTNNEEPEEKQTMIKEPKNPKVATLLSTFIPGAGQIYDEKYWKFPVIYGGFAAFLYFGNLNDNEYKKYRKAYEEKIDYQRNPEKGDPYPGIAAEAIQRERERWRRNRDLNYIGIGVLYILNIIDANVYAHLFDWDISEDLTLNICPEIENFGKTPLIIPQSKYIGVGLTVKF